TFVKRLKRQVNQRASRTVRLRQNLARDTGRRWGWRTLGRCFGGNELGNSADRARRKTRESSSRKHEILPACVRIISAVRTDADRKAFTNALARRSWGARSPAPSRESGCSSGAPPPHACARGPSLARRIALPNQPTTSAACWLWPSLMPRAFIQS